MLALLETGIIINLVALDVLTTYFALRGEFYELNPYVRILVKRFDRRKALTFWFFIELLVCLLLGFYVALPMLIVVVINNITLLINRVLRDLTLLLLSVYFLSHFDLRSSIALLTIIFLFFASSWVGKRKLE